MAKNAFIGLSGIARKIKQPCIGVDSVARKVKRCFIGVNGVARQFYQGGLSIADIEEGNIVYINENGSPAAFYIAKHNYESDLNGVGRTLLVRKDCYDKRAWHNSDINAYASSSIDTWLNGTYKNLFDADIQNIIGATKFYYTPGNGNKTVETLNRAIFMPSVTELGESANFANVEGSALPIATTLQIAYMNSAACNQWTRSPQVSGGTSNVCNIQNDGSVVGTWASNDLHGSRPCFTLPSGAVFDPKTMQFISA